MEGTFDFRGENNPVGVNCWRVGIRFADPTGYSEVLQAAFWVGVFLHTPNSNAQGRT